MLEDILGLNILTTDLKGNVNEVPCYPNMFFPMKSVQRLSSHCVCAQFEVLNAKACRECAHNDIRALGLMHGRCDSDLRVLSQKSIKIHNQDNLLCYF